MATIRLTASRKTVLTSASMHVDGRTLTAWHSPRIINVLVDAGLIEILSDGRWLRLTPAGYRAIGLHERADKVEISDRNHRVVSQWFAIDTMIEDQMTLGTSVFVESPEFQRYQSAKDSSDALMIQRHGHEKALRMYRTPEWCDAALTFYEMLKTEI